MQKEILLGITNFVLDWNKSVLKNPDLENLALVTLPFIF